MQVATGPAELRFGAAPASVFLQKTDADKEPVKPRPANSALYRGKGVSLLCVEGWQCRWPLDAPGADHMPRCCGALRLPRRPYCEPHARIAFLFQGLRVKGCADEQA